MGNKFVSAAGDNPLLKARPPADRRGAQMIAPSERAPRGKYAGGVLERQPMCEESGLLLSDICRSFKLLVQQDICVKAPAAYV